MYVEHCVCSLENAEQKPFKIRYDNHYTMPRTSTFLMYAMKETCCDTIQYTHFHQTTVVHSKSCNYCCMDITVIVCGSHDAPQACLTVTMCCSSMDEYHMSLH